MLEAPCDAAAGGNAHVPSPWTSSVKVPSARRRRRQRRLVLMIMIAVVLLPPRVAFGPRVPSVAFHTWVPLHGAQLIHCDLTARAVYNRCKICLQAWHRSILEFLWHVENVAPEEVALVRPDCIAAEHLRP